MPRLRRRLVARKAICRNRRCDVRRVKDGTIRLLDAVGIFLHKMIETESKVTPQIAAEHGLSPEEYARTKKILGRDPSFTELGIFSVMWSEHCSYKSSRVHLKRLPTRGT